MLLTKLGGRRALDISARMRELARVLDSLRATDSSRKPLNIYISGGAFESSIGI